MKIGFDISQVGKSKAGCGYFASSLIDHLAQQDKQNDYLLYSSFGDNYINRSFFITKQINQQNFHYFLNHFHPNSARKFWRTSLSNIEEKLGSPDIIHSNNYYCPQYLHHAKLIYTVYDLSFLKNPEWTTEENRIVCFNGLFDASIFADFIIAISENSRSDFLEIFPHYPADRIAVVYPASRFKLDTISKPNHLSQLQVNQFWLTVGTIEPRKNHLRLLKAYAKLKESGETLLPLVFAGGKGWLMDDFSAQISSLGLSNNVILLGYTDDTTLQWLYQNCFAAIYPSLFEGFGLPVVEAMTLGAPVITSNTSSIPEITQDAALLINPLDEAELTRAMQKLLNDENSRLQLKNQGMERSKYFSWQQSAHQTLAIYDNLFVLPKLPPAPNRPLPQECFV